jgi:hypothetical protein
MKRLPSPARSIRYRMRDHTVASGNPGIKRGITAHRTAARVLSATVLCLLPLMTLAATEALRPSPLVGTVHEYAGHLLGVDCAIWRIVEVAPDGSAVADCNGHRLETSGANDTNAVRVTDPTGRKLVEFRPFAPALKFPLAIGMRWRQGYVGFTAFNNLIWDGEAQCRVVAFEAVTVPAGTLDAFRIECVDKWMVGPKQGATHVTRWYAPVAETVVKQVHREDPARWNFELVRYGAAEPAPPPPAPTSMKLEAIPSPGPRPQYDPDAPDILDPDEY